METIIAEIQELRAASPMVFWGAACFYASLFLLLYSPFRRELGRLFTPPMPATQTQLKPLDSLRGIAAFASALYHIWAWNQAFYSTFIDQYPVFKAFYKSVPFFAVLSGFLIYRSIKRFTALEQFKSYAKRRILRIYPVYLSSLLCFFAFVQITPEIPHLLQRMLPEIFMLQIFGYGKTIYPGYWSIFVEELFYLSIPVWLFATRARPAFFAACALAVLTLAGNAVPDQLSILKFFFFGILLCELMESNWWNRISQNAAAAIFGLGFVVLALEHFYGDIIGQAFSFLVRPLTTLEFDVSLDPFNRYFTFSLGFALSCIVLGALKNNLIYRALSVAPLRFLGAMSYSLFVWNGFVMLVGTSSKLGSDSPQIIGYPMSGVVQGTWITYFFFYTASFLFFGALSYLAIERPFMLLRHGARFKLNGFKLEVLAPSNS